MSESHVRICKQCRETKPLDKDHFPPHARGYRHECIACENERNRERTCKWCGETKPLDKDHFPAHNHGFRHECITCRNDRHKGKYENDPDYRERQLQRQRDYRSDPEKLERMRAYQRLVGVRARKNQSRRRKYHEDADYRNNLLTQQKVRWDTDIEWRESIKAQLRERRASDPEWRERDNANQRQRRASDPMSREKQKERDLRKRYGIALSDYVRMEVEQGGLCAICQLEPEDALHVDHNHDTGQIRGLLCSDCNYGIGIFEESTNLLRSAITYLNRPSMRAQDIQTIPDDRLLARFHIPYWEAQSRDKQYRLIKNQNLRANFGIGIDQFEWLLEKNNGVCWICSLPEEQKSNDKTPYSNTLSVDHSHQTGMIRGLLCSSCNFGVGKFRDSPLIFAKAIAYLELWATSTGPESE